MLGNFLRHGSNAILASLALAAGAGFAAGKTKLRPGAVVAGAALFFASEYAIHRFLFHARPSPRPFVRSLQHRLHYDHHAEPGRLDLLFLPPWFVLPGLGASVATDFALARDPGRAASLLLGNLLGVLYYEWVHYVAHVPFRPRTRYGRWIKKYHLRHHFLNERKWFGVTSPAFDTLGRTRAGLAGAARSETTRLLFPSSFPSTIM
jgi:hypothetical protein